MSDQAEMAKTDDYEDRVVAFIDLLGFRELVSLSALHPQMTSHIYSFLKAIQNREVTEGIYGGIPVFLLDGTEAKPAKVFQTKEKICQEFKDFWPIAITQFSDSLVLSCKASDGMTCTLLLEFIARLTLSAFSQGFLLRGGVTKGLMIHQEGGPLFGPAFIEAYAMESKLAGWPRIVIDETVSALVQKSENELPNSKPVELLFSKFVFAESEIRKEIEGKLQLTLASAYRYLSSPKVNQQLLFDITATEAMLSSLAQTYATDDKLGKRYSALLKDWKSESNRL